MDQRTEPAALPLGTVAEDVMGAAVLFALLLVALYLPGFV